MPIVSIIAPIDQPQGKLRLIDELRACYADEKYSWHSMCVAFAKAGPLLKLDTHFSAFKKRGGKVLSIFGIDHKGTSIQALTYAMQNFDKSFITNYPYSTFHPKVFLFAGKKDAVAFIGSNNLTVGGLETNFESTVRLQYSLPDEKDSFQEVDRIFRSLMPDRCPATYELTQEVLDAHISDGLLLDEHAPKESASGAAKRNSEKKAPKRFYKAGLGFKPPSPLPKSTFPAPSNASGKPAQPATKTVTKPKSTSAASGLVIQIKPHHNGEIFLSKLAVGQNPDFFGWPFTGQTTPKILGNPSYPQRSPDPVVNITVIGKAEKVLLAKEKYPLNTVYYATKSEIRVTASPLIDIVPEYSILVMSKTEDPELDYELIIHTPESPDYEAWLEICTQTMPSGGKTARKFGWF